MLRFRVETAVYLKPGSVDGPRRTLHPLAMIQMGSALYLLADEPASSGKTTKLFALHRFRKVSMLEELSRAPKGYSLSRWLQSADKEGGNRSGTDAEIDLELRIAPEWVPKLKQGPIGRGQTIESDSASGWGTLRTRIWWTPMLVEWLLGRGEEVGVLNPPELRRMIASRLRRASRAYR